MSTTLSYGMFPSCFLTKISMSNGNIKEIFKLFKLISTYFLMTIYFTHVSLLWMHVFVILLCVIFEKIQFFQMISNPVGRMVQTNIYLSLMLYAAAFCEASLLYISSPLHFVSLVKDSSLFHNVYLNFSLVWQYNPIVSEIQTSQFV